MCSSDLHRVGDGGEHSGGGGHAVLNAAAVVGPVSYTHLAIFLDLIAREDTPFFSLKLCYEGETLTQAVLNGTFLKGGPNS